MSSYPTTNITNPGPHDILCGRGGGTNAHPGNIKFRKLVAAHKLRYLAASKSDKPGVAREVVKEWRNLNPPGRFLAKMDDGEEHPAQWYDVGDKKAREKASQCLRERNGAANEAVQALVKTVTANGEACPEDYATLMNKAAMVKARNDIALQQQKDMLVTMSQMAEFGNSFNNMNGQDEIQPYGLTDKMLSEYCSRGGGDGNNGGGGNNSFNDFNNGGGGGGFNDSFQQQFEQFQQMQNQFNRGNNNNGGGGNNNNNNNMNQMNNFSTEDEFIEAEIRRMLQQKQAQLQMAQQRLNNNNMGGGMNMGNNNMMNMNMGGGGGMNNRGGGGGFNNDNNQPYMGEESIMKEYMSLMQKQHQMNMNNGMGGGNNMGMMGNRGMGGGNGNGMNNMNQMNNMSNNFNDSEEWLWNLANGRGGGSGNNMMAQMGFNNNNFRQNMNNNMNIMNGGNMMGNSGGGMQDMGNSPNNDAARQYLNRLRGMRKGGGNNGGGDNRGNNSNPDNAFSGGGGGGNNNMMGGGGMMMNDQVASSMMGGGGGVQSGNQGQGGNSGGGGQSGRGFTIEEYQASLQEFLANDGDGGYNSKAKKSNNNDAQDPNNNFKTDYSGDTNVYQVPTSLGDKNSSSMRGRDSMQSVGTFARNTFQSVDSDCRRKSFESVDDMDVRPTFRSVDTMDMMSITNSVNDIIDDEVLRNPEMREKYNKRLSQNTDGSEGKFEVATLEVKTMDHGQGGGGDKPKKKGIDPRLIAMSGAKHTVQTKQEDGPGPGPAEKRSSMASVDSRMSFGNMSCMSELTDFGDLIAAVGAGKESEQKDIKL